MYNKVLGEKSIFMKGLGGLKRVMNEKSVHLKMQLAYLETLLLLDFK